MPQFDVSTFSSQAFWLALAFGVLYIIVSKIIAPKAESILTYRNRYLEENIASSEHYNEQARSLRQQKEKKLAELNADVELLRKNAIDALDKHFLTKKEILTAGLAQKTKESLAELQEYVNSFYTNDAKPCIDLAGFIIEKITDKPADLKLLEKIHGTE